LSLEAQRFWQAESKVAWAIGLSNCDADMDENSEDIQREPSQAAISPAQAAHIAARIGRLLFVSGADTGHTARSVTDVARHLGYTAHVLVTAGGILVTVGSNEQFSTKVGHEVTATGVDMGRLFELERIIDEIKRIPLDTTAIERRIDATETGIGGYPKILVMFGVGTTTGSLSMLFGSSLTVAAAAFAAGVVTAVLRRRLPALLPNPFAVTFAVAIISGLVAVFALRLTPAESPILALTAAGMILVPGVPLINSIRDLVTGHADNGMARLTGGTAVVLSIGFALYIVGILTGAELPVDHGPGMLPIGLDIFFSGLAAGGFALLFNVPRGAIGFCVVAGMVSHGLRTELETMGLTLPIASMFGAVAAALIARLAAWLHRVPAVVFAFPGVVALIPGSYGFRAGIAGLQVMGQGAAATPELVGTTLALAITTAVTTIAVGLGLALPLSGSPKSNWKSQ
jgi:uncharacterized membrane protein YjjP (DUF1212 family)